MDMFLQRIVFPTSSFCNVASLAFMLSHVPSAEGRGSLIDKHTIEVQLSAGGTKRITGKTILLANGGKPSKIDIPGSVSPTLSHPLGTS